jgi:hypothetical protein
MGQRHHHYEAAFEAWLRETRVPYVMVDERRRALSDDGSLKSLDFIVSPIVGPKLLIDVKGRQFPGSDRQSVARWTNWTPEADLAQIARWEELFGEGFRGLLVFAYETDQPARFIELAPFFRFRERYYAFYGVWMDDYRERTRRRSLSWETVDLSAADFREIRFRLEDLLVPEYDLQEDQPQRPATFIRPLASDK